MAVREGEGLGSNDRCVQRTRLWCRAQASAHLRGRGPDKPSGMTPNDCPDVRMTANPTRPTNSVKAFTDARGGHFSTDMMD